MSNQKQISEELKNYDSLMKNPETKFGGRLPITDRRFLSTIKSLGWVLVSKWSGGRDYIKNNQVLRIAIREKDNKPLDYCLTIKERE